MATTRKPNGPTAKAARPNGQPNRAAGKKAAPRTMGRETGLSRGKRQPAPMDELKRELADALARAEAAGKPVRAAAKSTGPAAKANGQPASNGQNDKMARLVELGLTECPGCGRPVVSPQVAEARSNAANKAWATRRQMAADREKAAAEAASAATKAAGSRKGTARIQRVK